MKYFGYTNPQEGSTGKWWLLGHDMSIGYWPKELFNHLASGASIVRYGGTSRASANEDVSPPIGGGSLPIRHYDYRVGFFGLIKIVDSNFDVVDIDRSEMKKNVDTKTSCYDLDYRGYESLLSGHGFTYGGPGGHHCGSN